MKKSSFLLVGICFCVCVSITLAQQRLPQQRAPQPVQKTTSTAKIDQFAEVLQGATSLKEVQTAFNGAGFSKTQVQQLQKQIEASSSLKKKLDSLYNQVEAAAKTETAKMNRQEAQQVAVAEKELNRELIDARAKSSLTTKQAISRLSDPEVRCQADVPTIRQVSDVMPGVEFVIQGRGLGKDTGTVDVWTGGRRFPALINEWNSCGVYAQLSSNISGITPDDQAAVDLKTRAGKEVRHFTKFTPLMDIELYQQTKTLRGWYWGASEDYTFWDRVLTNDWYVLTTVLRHVRDGHAEITQAPPENTPNCSTRTRVHQGVGALGTSRFTVSLRIAGPKGTSPY